jgi:Arc/MetJ family transcription regulator
VTYGPNLLSSAGGAHVPAHSFACSPHSRGIHLCCPVKPFAPKCASYGAMFDVVTGAKIVRTTVNIDEKLLAKAVKLTGPLDRSAVVHEGLRALIQRESAKRLARLGGSQPDVKAAPRRRQEIKS